MLSPASSLIEASAAAADASPTLSFFSEVEAEAQRRLEAGGEFTGERLHRDRPEVYRAVVRMAAEGLSISATARALGVSRNTVCAVREREGFSIEQEKKELLRDFRRAQRLSVEKVIELLPEVKSAKDAAIVAAVMTDKAQLLSGEATARVERVEIRPDMVRSFLDSLPVIEGEVIEASGNGVTGEKDLQMLGAGDGGGVDCTLADVASADCQSSDLPVVDTVTADVQATCQATLTADAGGVEAPDGCRADGGGGGAAFVGGVPWGIDSDAQNFGQRAHEALPQGDASDGAGGAPVAGDTLCKPTKKKGGRSTVASTKPRSKTGRISPKKKGGSGC